MFIRLVVPVRHEDSHCPTGVFQAAYRLRDNGLLDDAERQRFEGLRRWFNRHLPVPGRLSRSRRAHVHPNAVCWLKADATEHLGRLHELAALPARTTRARARPAPKAPRGPAAAAPQDVAITHPDKVLYPDDGITKADVAAYYRALAPRLLPFLKDRPVTLERLPDGVGEGKPVAYALVNDLPTLLYLVNQGALTFHLWLSRVGSLDWPDFLLFDLDPGEAPFADVVMVARRLHDELTGENREAVVKTSGKTGLHVLVRWREAGGYDEARAWALGIAGRVARALPETATVEIRKAKRGGRVYLDVLQNARGHHAVPPYVLRAVPGATVSTPLRWAELKADLDPKRFTLRTVPARVARLKEDPAAPLLAGR